LRRGAVRHHTGFEEINGHSRRGTSITRLKPVKPALPSRPSWSEDRSGLFISVSRCGGREGGNAGHRCNCNQQESDRFHRVPPSNFLSCKSRSVLAKPLEPQWARTTISPG